MTERRLTLGSGVEAAIRTHGQQTYPHECCGALVGRGNHVSTAVALENTTEEGPRRRFLVRPSDYREAERRAVELGGEPLGPFTDKQDAVDAAGTTVGELLADLTRKHSGLKAHLFNEQGKLRSFVNVYVNDEDIRYLQKEQTPVTAGDTVSIIPSVAGGAPAVTDVVSGFSRTLPELTNDEIKRYSRHLIMPEVGVEGQRKLKASKVLCIGAGGLGSPVAMYLTDVGRSKLASAKDRLQALNPNVDVVTHETAISSENALQLFEPYDVIVDGTDNFPTRYLVNDACVLTGKPNAYGSIFRFEGQASVFGTKEGPCYRCLYPEPPPPGLVPSCAEGGVLGILPGLVGLIQATEAIKLILGSGDPLIGRLLLVDAMGMKFRELKLRKNPDCPVCGKNPSITKLIDYQEFCGIRGEENPVTSAVPEMQPAELKQRLDRGDDLFVVDVREPHEYQICNLGGHLIPLGDLPKRVHELDSSREIVAHCKMGGRSAKAVDFLRQAGFKKVRNLAGGINAWSEKVDPKVPKY